ncbi:NUDIX hydrolase domain-like protein [Leucosporidium creatinivorum]|uniref:NAD(+) diphosphatase n=1 Tax=Leucosporidium creatinivorum TaxID=106004 RepID=A0A1Y2F8Q6_9BASI|nr:NUDIX hydrolase domain-like protein [Leucosporidium creatinivorum]
MAYYAGNPLNRLSYLRSSAAFLASALESNKSRFVVYDSLNPLVAAPLPDGTKKLLLLKWDDLKQYIVGAEGNAQELFKGVDGKEEVELGRVPSFIKPEGGKSIAELTAAERRHVFINLPPLVFLGVDERSAPASAKSLPLSKPDEHSTLESHSPYGVPYWSFDVTALSELKEKLLKENQGAEFADMRAGMQTIPNEEASIGAEGRALVDWNKRNLFCPACSRPLRSVWAGWKRACVPGEPSAEGLDAPPACISKKGVHNFNYPRTDPVVIMAICSPDRESILLGRQKVWPKKFYSCLAGFIESGETIEEAVRREVYEEAGVEVGDVFYHSSQPWPYPSSLMIGAIGVAKEGQTIRCDLDNELEDARWFTRAEVLAVIEAGPAKQMSREEVAQIDGKEDAKSTPGGENTGGEEGWFRMPPATAIANTLCVAWAKNTYLGAAQSSSSGKL